MLLSSTTEINIIRRLNKIFFQTKTKRTDSAEKFANNAQLNKVSFNYERRSDDLDDMNGLREKICQQNSRKDIRVCVGCIFSVKSSAEVKKEI